MQRPENTRARVVLTTAPSLAVAEELAETLVAERLAACANVLPGVTSIYRWRGEVQREAEVLVILKTTADGVDDLEARVVALHPYDVPEVVAIPIEAGHAPYLSWVAEQVGP